MKLQEIIEIVNNNICSASLCRKLLYSGYVIVYCGNGVVVLW